MQKVIISDIELEYLEKCYPNEYVVCVKIDPDNAIGIKTILNIFADLNFSDDEIADVINNQCVFLVCESNEEAYDLFDAIDLEGAPDVYLWGPIELSEIEPWMDEKLIKDVNEDNETLKKQISIHPNGTILEDNR